MSAMTDVINQTPQTANALLDAVILKNQLKNDAALSRLLGVAPPVVSKVRHQRLPIGLSLLVRIHDKACINIDESRKILAQTAIQ